IRGGNAVLPGTAVVEIARAAGSAHLGLTAGEPVEVRDLMLVAPLEVPDHGSRLVSVVVESAPVTPGPRTTGSSVEITVRSRAAGEDEATEHGRALVGRHLGAPPGDLPIADLEARCGARTLDFEEGRQSL